MKRLLTEGYSEALSAWQAGENESLETTKRLRWYAVARKEDWMRFYLSVTQGHRVSPVSHLVIAEGVERTKVVILLRWQFNAFQEFQERRYM